MVLFYWSMICKASLSLFLKRSYEYLDRWIYRCWISLNRTIFGSFMMNLNININIINEHVFNIIKELLGIFIYIIYILVQMFLLLLIIDGQIHNWSNKELRAPSIYKICRKLRRGLKDHAGRGVINRLRCSSYIWT